MVIRIFVALLALNMLTFVVRADAAEREPVLAEIAVDNLYQLQEQMSGDFERDETDALTEIGSRLLSLGFNSAADDKSYASQAVKPDHGVALLQRGACLNLKWKF
ncbi:hypothetical protein [Marinobacter sp. SS21]|uniref:hypothetical protein n=1 Tax=Marinobacter sp. SS21 TaxID=2979460 RepID=UPI00232FF5E6|nr:hypothetical protein [Marinobacter sp. SS21]MDC0662586.1 hypothetical protein [Marinobacter sp. SS21]